MRNGNTFKCKVSVGQDSGKGSLCDISLSLNRTLFLDYLLLLLVIGNIPADTFLHTLLCALMDFFFFIFFNPIAVDYQALPFKVVCFLCLSN